MTLKVYRNKITQALILSEPNVDLEDSQIELYGLIDLLVAKPVKRLIPKYQYLYRTDPEGCWYISTQCFSDSQEAKKGIFGDNIPFFYELYQVNRTYKEVKE